MKSLSKYAACSLITQLGVLATTLFGQEPPAPATAQLTSPRIQFAETNFNFGTVHSAEILRHDFIITNSGSAVLEITNVHPACGCTTTSNWDRRIEPGKTGAIPILFNPGHFRGLVTKTITVFCNDPAQGISTLQIETTIQQPFDVIPSYVNFLPLQNEPVNQTKTLRITNNLEEAVSLEPPVSTNAAFRAELKTVQPGKAFELQVTCTSSTTNEHGTIRIKTSSSYRPELAINVSVLPQPLISVSPKFIQVQASPLATNYWFALQVRNNGHDPIGLKDPSVNVKGMTAEVTETQPGKAFTVALTFAPDFKMAPGEKGELTLKTTHPRNPVLKVPIFQMQRIAAAASQVQAKPADAK